MSAITMPLHLPYKMRVNVEQLCWAALTTALGLAAIYPLAMGFPSALA